MNYPKPQNIKTACVLAPVVRYQFVPGYNSILKFKTKKAPIWAEKSEHDRFFTELTGLRVSDDNRSSINFRLKQVVLFTVLGIIIFILMPAFLRRMKR